MVNIRMINLCGYFIYKPLEMIFKSCLIKPRNFSAEWKKIGIVPVHKKGDHQCLNNYILVSLLPVFSKIFERPFITLCLNFFKETILFPLTS